MSRPIKASAVLVFLTLILASCGDPAGPCDHRFACEVTGVDLYVPELNVVTDQRDPTTGLGIADGSPVELEFTVRNRGDSTSAPASLVLRFGHVSTGVTSDSTLPQHPADTVAIPPLRPGESYQHHTVFDTWERKDNPRQAYEYNTDDTSFGVAELLVADRDSSNNRRLSASVHVRVALLDMKLVVPDTALWVGRPFPARLTITNVSRHGALPAAGVGFWLCEVAGPSHCDVAGDMGFGTHDMTLIPPGGRYDRDLTLTVPSAAGSQAEIGEYVVIIKVVEPGTRDTLLWRGGEWISDAGPRIRLHPDYRACQPPLLVADQPATAPLVCKHPQQFFVYELAARADREYLIEQPDNPGATVYRREGSKVMDINPNTWYRFNEAETYWIVDFVTWQYRTTTRTIVLRERPPN